jgi:PAS domain-containing protein
MTVSGDSNEPSEEHLSPHESGIFTWDLRTNVVYADGALAALFGLPSASTIAGLPVEAYIARIHENDRAHVAKAIGHAVVTGAPYHEVYRVLDNNGAAREVMAFGRCFRDAEGVPSQYAGIVFPMTGGTEEADPLFAHIATAHRLAVEAGRTKVADGLEAILVELAAASHCPEVPIH